MLICSDGSYYTGATIDVEKRLKVHNSGKGSKYVRSRRPAVVLGKVGPMEKLLALALERTAKSLCRSEKKMFIESLQQGG